MRPPQPWGEAGGKGRGGEGSSQPHPGVKGQPLAKQQLLWGVTGALQTLQTINTWLVRRGFEKGDHVTRGQNKTIFTRFISTTESFPLIAVEDVDQLTDFFKIS